MSENNPENAVKLARLASHFQKAVEAKISADLDAQEKINKTITQDEIRDLQAIVQDIVTEATIAAKSAALNGADTTELQRKIAPKVIRLADKFAEIAKRAYSDDNLAAEIPKADRTEDNAKAFSALGADNLARLCRK